MPKKQIDDGTWEQQKDAIVSLFVEEDMSLVDLVRTMDARGFRASKGQFERQLKQRKAIIKKVTIRKTHSRPSDVWFQNRRIPSSRVEKAVQRYGLPNRVPSSPTPELMDSIQISIPPPTPVSESITIDRAPNYIRNHRIFHMRRDSSYHYTVNMDNLPFLELQSRLEELFELALRVTSRPVGLPYLERFLPIVAQQLLGPRMRPGFLRGRADCETWESILEKMSFFPIPLKKPDAKSPASVYLWILEFVIGSTNGLLRPYQDASLEWLVETISMTEAIDTFFELISKFDLYVVIEKILDLNTTATDSFASTAILSSIRLEDQRLLDNLLRRKVRLDSIEKANARESFHLCAMHLAVECQNETFIRRLLNAGIDPDGYLEEENYTEKMKPLSWLMHLFAVRNDPRVTHISNGIVKLVLEARRTVYDARDCEMYLGTLFIRGWLADATSCLVSLRQ